MFSQIDTFEQQCVVIKGMFQQPRLKDHVQTSVGPAEVLAKLQV